jgi:DNA invertase Pin-like site-specific DNA recombinase
MSDKIGERHLRRNALLYIRQSTTQQLLHNEESRRLQYAMRERLVSLGWHEVELIDEDPGRSAGGHVERPGFERLVAQVSLGQVGVVAARELSRFARNSRDRQQLLELCRYVDTLLVDQDAVYDVRQSNDRLLLGLKGSLNEYELELLRLRAQEARRHKAQRGEYLGKVAVGYRKSDEGALEKTPDLRVQQAIALVFAKFVELGSIHQVLTWFRDEGIELPLNRNHRGHVRWTAPRYTRLHDILTNPVYAGAYAYGRTQAINTLVQGRPRTRVMRKPRSEWKVLLRDRHEAYIDWESFERIQTMIARNAQSRRPAVPGGPGTDRGLVRRRGQLHGRRGEGPPTGGEAGPGSARGGGGRGGSRVVALVARDRRRYGACRREGARHRGDAATPFERGPSRGGSGAGER